MFDIEIVNQRIVMLSVESKLCRSKKCYHAMEISRVKARKEVCAERIYFPTESQQSILILFSFVIV